MPARLHPTTYVTDNAISRLDAAAGADEPFLLYVSFPDPHHPFAPPTEYWNRYSPADMPLPETFGDTHEGSPDYVQRMLAEKGTPHPDPTMTWAPTEDQFRHALAAELGSIEFIDDSVGRILETLERNGQLDSTVIVFTADHGDVFGDHGLMLKHFTHYEGVVRVPLIVYAPGLGSGSHGDLVSSADIAPTIIELAGLDPMPAAQGESLVPVMHGAPGPHRALLVEEDQPFGLEGLPGPVRFRTVITRELRLTHIAGHGVTELYDLRVDPAETRNLAHDPSAAGLLAEGTAVMLDEVLRLIDDSTVPFHAA